MNRILKSSLIPIFTAALTATPFEHSWKDAPVSQWSEEDAKQILTDSPWVKKVQLDRVRNLSPFERRDSGDWEAGIPSGIGMATLGLMADWRDIEALEHAYALSNLGPVTVRWESAFPVRAAEAKLGEVSIAGVTENDYAIAVSDVHPPFRWNLAKQLQGVAFLKIDKKKVVKPTRVLVQPKAAGFVTLVYLFPRSIEISKKGQSLGFVAQIGRLFVAVNFFPQEMRLQNELQL